MEIQFLISCCHEALKLAEPILTNKELKPITHQHINALIQQVKILAETSLFIPRYFFQTLQSTSVKVNNYFCYLNCRKFIKIPLL